MGSIEKVANSYWVRGGKYYEKGDCIMFDRCNGGITSYRLRQLDYRDNGSSREQDRDDSRCGCGRKER